MALREEVLGTWPISCHQLARELASPEFRRRCLDREGCFEVTVGAKAASYKKPIEGALVKTVFGQPYAVVNEYYTELYEDGEDRVFEWTVDCEGAYSDCFGVVNKMVLSPENDNKSMHTRVRYTVSVVFTRPTWLKAAIEALTTKKAARSSTILSELIDEYVTEYERRYVNFIHLIESQDSGKGDYFLNLIRDVLERAKLDDQDETNTLSAVSVVFEDAIEVHASFEENTPVLIDEIPEDSSPNSTTLCHVQEYPAQLTQILPQFWPYVVLVLLFRVWLLLENNFRRHPPP